MTYATIETPNGFTLFVRGEVQHGENERGAYYDVPTIEVAGHAEATAPWRRIREDWHMTAENALLAAWSRGRWSV